MKAVKVTVTIVVEALSVDALGSLVNAAVERVQHEYTNGELQADDGDTVRWTTTLKPVAF